MLERELVPDIDGSTAEGGTMEIRIQLRTAPQQSGLSDSGRVCGPGPFAAWMIDTAGAQAVKAQDELAALGLDRPPRRPRSPHMAAKGQTEVLCLNRVSQFRLAERTGAGQVHSDLDETN